jgi:hypothetical protein
LPQNTWKSFMRGRRSHNHVPKVVGWSSQQQPASCRTTPKPTHSRNHPSSTAFCPFPNLLMCLPPFPLPQELIFSNPTTSWEKKSLNLPHNSLRAYFSQIKKNPKPSPMLSSRGGRSSQIKDLFLSSPLDRTPTPAPAATTAASDVALRTVGIFLDSSPGFHQGFRQGATQRLILIPNSKRLWVQSPIESVSPHLKKTQQNKWTHPIIMAV